MRLAFNLQRVHTWLKAVAGLCVFFEILFKKHTLIKGKAASTNAGFQENISREKALGDSMKQAEKVAYKEAEDGKNRGLAKSLSTMHRERCRSK